VWEIWNYKMIIVFKNEEVDVEKIFYLVQLKGWMWSKYKRRRLSFSVSDWFHYPSRCLEAIT